MSPGGQMGLRLGSITAWLTASFRDPIEYISETVSVAKTGGYGLVDASRANDDLAANMNTFGVGAFGYNDYATVPNPVWASYMEKRRNDRAEPLFGIELDFVNQGADFKETTVNTIDPYSATSPVIDIRLTRVAALVGIRALRVWISAQMERCGIKVLCSALAALLMVKPSVCQLTMQQTIMMSAALLLMCVMVMAAI